MLSEIVPRTKLFVTEVTFGEFPYRTDEGII